MSYLMGPTLLVTYFLEYLGLGSGDDLQGRTGVEGYEPLVASLFISGFLAWAVSFGEGAGLMLVLLGTVYVYRMIVLSSVTLSDSYNAGIATLLFWLMAVVFAVQCAGWRLRRQKRR